MGEDDVPGDDPTATAVSGAGAGAGPGTAEAFAPEAHLPAERRLLVDGSGVALELELGLRHSLPWADIDAVLAWPDRIELVLNEEVSVLVRAKDWHRGDRAVAAIRALAPVALLVLLPGDTEPEPDGYTLTGLAKASSVVIGTLIFAEVVLALLGLVIGFDEGRGSAVTIGALSAIAAAFGTRGLVRRLRVPRRWRARAAVRGRSNVAAASWLARASDRHVRIAELALFVASLAVLLVTVAIRHPFGLPSVLLLVLALSARLERARRSWRREC